MSMKDVDWFEEHTNRIAAIIEAPYARGNAAIWRACYQLDGATVVAKIIRIDSSIQVRLTGPLKVDMVPTDRQSADAGELAAWLRLDRVDPTTFKWTHENVSQSNIHVIRNAPPPFVAGN